MAAPTPTRPQVGAVAGGDHLHPPGPRDHFRSSEAPTASRQPGARPAAQSNRAAQRHRGRWRFRRDHREPGAGANQRLRSRGRRRGPSRGRPRFNREAPPPTPSRRPTTARWPLPTPREVEFGIPVNMTFASVTPPAGWSCTTPPLGSMGKVRCIRATDMAAGVTESFT